MTANSVIVTTTVASDIIPIDLRRFRYGIGIIVTIPEGSSATYDVQVTGDDLGRAAPTNWNKHDVLQGKSASANSNLAYPVTGIRIKAASIAGSLVLAVVQGEGT